VCVREREKERQNVGFEYFFDATYTNTHLQHTQGPTLAF